MLIRLKFGPNESYCCGAVWPWGCRTMMGLSHHGGCHGRMVQGPISRLVILSHQYTYFWVELSLFLHSMIDLYYISHVLNWQTNLCISWFLVNYFVFKLDWVTGHLPSFFKYLDEITTLKIKSEYRIEFLIS